MSEPLAYLSAHPVLGATEANSLEELTAILRQLGEGCGRPILATVKRRDGDMLSIGLGRPFSVLTYVSSDDDPPYYTSLGNVEPTDRVIFDYLDQPSEFGRRNAVTLDEAFETMRRFVSSSDLPLPDVVGWEEV